MTPHSSHAERAEETGFSPEFDALSAELAALETGPRTEYDVCMAARSRLMGDVEGISHQLTPTEVTELAEQYLYGGVRVEVLAAYANEYFTSAGTYNHVREEFRTQRRAEAFTMQNKALGLLLEEVRSRDPITW